MLNPEQVYNYFPPYLRENPAHRKYLIKEYLQLQILDYLSGTKYVKKIAFIGGTNLRLVTGIDRFSEDLDFDCKNLSNDDFIKMTDDVIRFLNLNGLKAEAKDKQNPKLTAYRRNIYLPEFLFEIGLSGHIDERFLIKIESEDQKFSYIPMLKVIQGCGFLFSFPTPPDDILSAMKFSALLSRSKGRDFYDAMFLSAISKPNFEFLSVKQNISNNSELKAALKNLLAKTNLQVKSKDFEHLLFNKKNSEKILLFESWIEML
ncbi:MAG TPA: hypothetical protein DCQ31_14500 [Bacteroidales bacterium]|nr:hypothetical protein [Bacteroidales bacterium]